MSHETAPQRARRHRADRFRGAKLAPSIVLPSSLCEQCQHGRLIHRDDAACLRNKCTCEAFGGVR